MQKLNFILILIPFFLSACNNKLKEDAERVMHKAGKNRQELQRVIDYYKQQKDVKKLNAAYFLIGNMEEKYGIYFPEDAYYFKILAQVDSLKQTDASVDQLNNFVSQEWKKFNRNDKNQIPRYAYKDIEIITADYLIENIDLAFQVWREKSWAKHLNFNEFCEWILPYRINDEPLQNWRKFLYEKLNWVEDSMKNPRDVQEACMLVNEFIAKDYLFLHKLNFIPYLGGIDSWKYKSGICEQRYALIIMAMRSIGIPVANDYTLQFPRGTGSHSWTVLLDSDGKVKSFNGGEKNIKIMYPNVCPISLTFFENITTAYRLLYAKNTNPLVDELSINDVPENFQFMYMKNVTDEYGGLPKIDIKLKLNKNNNSKYAYLYSFKDATSLGAIAYSKIRNNRVKFNNIGRNGIYMVGYYKNKKITLDGDPFIVPSKKGEIQPINIDFDSLVNVRLYRKYDVQWDIFAFIDAMKGARLQGANKPDFSDSTTIYEIDTTIHYFMEFAVEPKQEYRYYRYLSSDTGDIRIADIIIFQKNKNAEKKIVDGRVFGYISDKETKDDGVFENAFDNNIRTNFNAPKGSWVAIDAKAPVKISSFKIMVRNHFNIIEINDTYELFYFNRGWHSLGKKVAYDNYIDYENVPKNAILLLRNLSRGNEERIFLYENGKQVWW